MRLQASNQHYDSWPEDQYKGRKSFDTYLIQRRIGSANKTMIELRKNVKGVALIGRDSLAAVELRNWFVSGLEANVGVMEILGGRALKGWRVMWWGGVSL